MKDGNRSNPIIREVQKQYVRYRKKGLGREEAIKEIRTEYAQELCDEDDKIAVLLGLSLALCKKKELFAVLAEETLDELQRIYCANKEGILSEREYVNFKEYLEKKEMYGEEAFYKKVSRYVPGWKVGDIFSHRLTYPASKPLGIEGWFILFVKVGEYIDEFDIHHQLMCISLCPPDKVPSSSKEFEELGFLPVMNTVKEEYLAQITIKSRKAERGYELCKIGCFPDVMVPSSCLNENPLTAMPLFGKTKKDELWIGYEDQICRFYKRFGMKK